MLYIFIHLYCQFFNFEQSKIDFEVITNDPMCMTSDKMVQKANSVVLISLKETVCCKAPLRARIIGQLAESSFPGVPQLLKLTSSLVGFLI